MARRLTSLSSRWRSARAVCGSRRSISDSSQRGRSTYSKIADSRDGHNIRIPAEALCVRAGHAFPGASDRMVTVGSTRPPALTEGNRWAWRTADGHVHRARCWAEGQFDAALVGSDERHKPDFDLLTRGRFGQPSDQALVEGANDRPARVVRVDVERAMVDVDGHGVLVPSGRRGSEAQAVQGLHDF